LGDGGLGAAGVSPFLEEQGPCQDWGLVLGEGGSQPDQQGFGLAWLALALEHVGQQEANVECL
jgi:hypothetical protein